MYMKLQLHGPLHVNVALDCCVLELNREALAVLFTGGLFLARYARNSYCRDLVPSPQHPYYHVLAIERDAMCMYCWHYSPNYSTEDEQHFVADEQT